MVLKGELYACDNTLHVFKGVGMQGSDLSDSKISSGKCNTVTVMKMLDSRAYIATYVNNLPHSLIIIVRFRKLWGKPEREEMHVLN